MRSATGSTVLTLVGSLNEGRGINPGDTSCLQMRQPHAYALNEGRGINPGDTRRGSRGKRLSPIALNEGRGINPGDTCLRLQPCGSLTAW